MAFNGINSVLGTGGGKPASRGKQGRNQDLICPDQDKEKAGGAFLQKIYHYSPSSQHQAFPVKTLFLVFQIGQEIESFLQKYLTSALEQVTNRPCNVRRSFQTETFPYRYNYIHERQLTSLGTFFLKETFVYSEEFPDYSLDPVSLCRSLELAMNTDSKPVMR
jgi:hypothetical protein